MYTDSWIAKEQFPINGSEIERRDAAPVKHEPQKTDYAVLTSVR